MSESVDFQYGSIVIRNGIMQCTFDELAVLDLEITKHLVKKRIEQSKGESYPCLFDITLIKESTKESRDYLANEGNELVIASALLVNSAVIKMAANFYISVNKPVKPTRLFTEKEAALKWLALYTKASSTS